MSGWRRAWYWLLVLNAVVLTFIAAFTGFPTYMLVLLVALGVIALLHRLGQNWPQ